MFPLSDSGYAGAFQDVMHMVVTALVVLLSIVSMTVTLHDPWAGSPLLHHNNHPFTQQTMIFGKLAHLYLYQF